MNPIVEKKEHAYISGIKKKNNMNEKESKLALMEKFKFQEITWKIHPKLSQTHREWFLVIDDFMILERFMELKAKNLMGDYHYVKTKEKRNGERLEFHNYNRQQDAIEISLGMNPQKTLVDDVSFLSDKFLSTYYRIFTDKGIIYICKNTAIRPLDENSIVIIHNEKYNDKLIFPSYTLKDIKVQQWKGGKHWYATVGGMQVERRNRIKWNTPKEANQVAEEFLKEINKG